MFPYSALNDSGVLQLAFSGTVSSRIGGIGYVDSSVYATNAANEDSDQFINGLRVSAAGALRVSYDAPELIKAGLGITNDGRLCVNSLTTPAYRIAGLGVAANGVVAASSQGIVADGILLGDYTFTNATAGRSYFDSDGLLQTVGANVARKTYIGGNPYLWIDGAVTELSGYSFDLVNWPGGAATALKNATGLDGASSTGFTVTDSSAVAVENTRADVSIVSGTNTYYLHCSLAYNASPSVYSRVYIRATGGTEIIEAVVVDPADGTYVEQTSDGAVVLEPIRIGDFWHFVLSLTDNNTGNGTLNALIQPAYNTNGDGTLNAAAQGSTVFGHCALYKDNFSLMPVLSTGGSTKSVAADVASLPVGSWYNSSSGTVLANVWSPQVASGAQRNVYQFSDTSTDNRLVAARNGAGKDQIFVVDDGTTGGNIASSSSIVAGQLQKIGYGFAEDDCVIYVDGSSEGTDTNVAMPRLPAANVYIGNSSSGTVPFYGGIKDLTYVNRRLTNAELAAQTT